MESVLDWINPQELQELAGVDATTARRWKKRAPKALPRWLKLLVNTVHRGQLDELHPIWRGWRISKRDGALITPGGEFFTQARILALEELLDAKYRLLAELNRLRGEVRVQAPCGLRRRRRLRLAG